MVPSHLYFCLLDWSQASDDTFICQYHKNAIHLMGCNKSVLCLERFKYHQVHYKAIKISTNNDSIDICCDNIENIDHWADYFVIINTWSTCMEDLDNVLMLISWKYLNIFSQTNYTCWRSILNFWSRHWLWTCLVLALSWGYAMVCIAAI